MTRNVTVLLAVGVVGAALTACSSSGGEDSDNIPVLEAGQSKQVCCTSQSGSSAVPVHLPAGILDVITSEVGERYDDDTPDLDVDDIVAGDDAVLVEVAWELDVTSAYPSEIHEILDARTTRDYLDDWDAGLLELRVVAGDTEVELPDPSLNDRFLVAVPAGAEPVLEVEYDGLTQSFSIAARSLDEGRAADLRDLVVPAGSGKRYGGDRDWLDGPSCAAGFERVEEGLDPSVACHTSLAALVPYVAGQGWAPEGKSFVVVDFDHSALRPHWIQGDSWSDYRLTGQAWSTRLAGEEPVATSKATYGGQRLVFLLDTGSRLRLEVTGDLQFARQGGGVGPRTTSHHLAETLELVAFPPA